MQDAENINVFNRLHSEAQLFQFLSGVDDICDGERRDLLNKSPLPMVEKAFASIRREGVRRGLIGSKQETMGAGVGSGLKIGPQNEVIIGQELTSRTSLGQTKNGQQSSWRVGGDHEK